MDTPPEGVRKGPMKAMVDYLVPSRDGVGIAANIFMPDGPGPFPVLITRSPYGINKGTLKAVKERVANGYVMIDQVCRGKHNSEGTFRPVFYEEQDGQATIDWVAEQPWCNGRIGLIVNMARGRMEAGKCFRKISSVCRQFLKTNIRNYGYIVLGDAVGQACQKAIPLTRVDPESDITRCIGSILRLITMDESAIARRRREVTVKTCALREGK